MPDINKVIDLSAGTRKLPSASINAEFLADTVDLEKRTVEVVFTTGQRGPAYIPGIGDVLEELEVTAEAVRSERLEKGLSVCDNHSRYSVDNVFGITGAYRFEDGKLIGTARFAEDQRSDEIFQKVATRILPHFSLGYRRHKMMQVGEEDGIPVVRVMDWTPTELSITPVSFETENGVRSGEQHQTFDCEIEENDMFIGKRYIKRSPDNPDAGGAAPAATPAGGESDANVDDGGQGQRTEATPAVAFATPEQTVAAPAVATVATRKAGDYLAIAEKAGMKADEATRAFDEGVTLEAFTQTAFEHLASNNQSPGAVIDDGSRNDHHEFKMADLGDAIRARVTGDYSKLTDGSRALAYMNLMEAMRHYYLSSGKRDVMGMSNLAFAGRALNITTSDFPLILENVMNKELLAAYEETPRTFMEIARKTTVNDFREKNTYKMGDAPSLLPLGENGEYQYGKFSESKESYRISTYARKLGYTRQMMINDDLSALSRFPQLFGPAAARLESDIVWGLLLNWDFIRNVAANHTFSDGHALFAAEHNNLITDALSTDGLSALRKLGRKQRTLDGNFMNVNYSVLAVGESLETSLEQILKASIVADEVTKTNIFREKFSMIVEPRIEAAAAANATAFYGFNKQHVAVEYAHLAGNEGLYTEVSQSTDIDGTTILARHDFGAGYEDYRGAAKSLGDNS